MGKTQHQNLSWIPYITIVIVLHIIGFSFLWIAGREHHIFIWYGYTRLYPWLTSRL